jgi:AcrR family transcriptional regulator
VTTDPGRPRDPDIDERIVEVARVILDREGAEALSIARVAKEAGVGRPTVYRRYRDADDLLRAILFAELDHILVVNRDLYEAPLPPGDLVDHLVIMSQHSFRFYAANPARSRLLLSAAVLAEPVWQARWNTLNAQVGAIVHKAIAAAVDRGEIPADTDRDLLLLGYFSIMLSVLLGGLVDAYGPVENWSAVLRALLTQQVEGLRLRVRAGQPDRPV